MELVIAIRFFASTKKVHDLFGKRSQFREVEHFIKNKAGAKMFFIFATRSNQDGCDNELPVYVAEIMGAAPNLIPTALIRIASELRAMSPLNPCFVNALGLQWMFLPILMLPVFPRVCFMTILMAKTETGKVRLQSMKMWAMFDSLANDISELKLRCGDS